MFIPYNSPWPATFLAVTNLHTEEDPSIPHTWRLSHLGTTKQEKNGNKTHVWKFKSISVSHCAYMRVIVEYFCQLLGLVLGRFLATFSSFYLKTFICSQEDLSFTQKTANVCSDFQGRFLPFKVSSQDWMDGEYDKKSGKESPAQTAWKCTKNKPKNSENALCNSITEARWIFYWTTGSLLMGLIPFLGMSPLFLCS